MRARATKIAAAVGAFAIAALAAAPAGAFCRTTTCTQCDLDPISGCVAGDPIVWPRSCISFSMQYRASAKVPLAPATAIVARAFGVWQDVVCPDTGEPPAISLSAAFGTVACDAHEYNQTDGNANVVMFRDDVWPYDGAGNVLALTTVTFSKRTGEVYDADMEINSTQPIGVSEEVDPHQYDLQSIVTHEVGHFLGLAHSTDPDATMWAAYRSGSDAFRRLSADDVAAICAVYPATASRDSCDYRPRQGFSPECGIFPASEGICAVSARGRAARSPGGLFAWGAGLAVAVARGRRGAGRRRGGAG